MLFHKKAKALDDPEGNTQEYFGLSRSQWLVLPRVALQSMSPEWQSEFFKRVRQIDETLEFPQGYTGNFMVTMKDKNNHIFVKHVIPHYRHNTLPRKSKAHKHDH